MTQESTLVPVIPSPGIQRDGTVFDVQTVSYVDGEWVRFQRGRPRKMGGYRTVSSSMKGTVRKLLVNPFDSYNTIVCFSDRILEVNLYTNGACTSGVTRTPSLLPVLDYQWSTDVMFDDAVGSQNSLILAIPTTSLFEENNLYYGVVDQQLPFQKHDTITCRGVFVTQPYTIYYGLNGSVTWSDANQPLTIDEGDAGSDRVTSRHFVTGISLPTGSGPGGLLFSFDSVVRMDWVGGQAVFKFTTLSASSSILSQNCVAEFNGDYFWIGVDRFFVCNGQRVDTLPNTTNLNWFFDNLNFEQAHKIWAEKVPKFGEIVWHFPSGNSIECDKAIVFNTVDKCWYDYSLSRTAGEVVDQYTISVLGYNLYRHEDGTDYIVGNNTYAIPSSVTTSHILPENTQSWVRVKRIEPDFVLDGDINIEVITKEFANSNPVSAFSTNVNRTTEKVDLRVQGRYVQLKYTSNFPGSNYQIGKILVHVELGDSRS